MKKSIYLPTAQNTAILRELDHYYEIILDGECKTVVQNEVKIAKVSSQNVSLKQLEYAIFGDIIRKLYSYNTNLLNSEPHQYEPLIKLI